MSTTTVFGQAGTEQASTHPKRNAVIALTVIALSIVSFFVGRVTAPSHAGSSAQVAIHTQLSPADRAIVATDGATTVGTVAAQLSPADRAIVANDVANIGTVTTEKMSAANREEVANDVASSTGTSTSKLTPANRALIANDVAPIAAPISQVNTTSCVAGRPC